VVVVLANTYQMSQFTTRSKQSLISCWSETLEVNVERVWVSLSEEISGVGYDTASGAA
jgi:hypothetical protein